jgi:signal transduction histidine kinase
MTPENRRTQKEYEQTKAWMTEILKTEQASWLNQLHEIDIRHSDGTLRTLQQLPFSIEMDGGFMMGSVFRDITGCKQAEEQVKRLNENLGRHAQELAALNKAIRAIASTLDLKEVLESVIGEVRSLLGTEGASVILHDPTLAKVGGELIFAAGAGPGVEQFVGARMPVTAGIAGAVWRERQPALVRDAQSDPRFYSQIDARTGLTTHSLVAVPLVSKGEILGVIEAINKASGAFDEHDLETLETMASSAATAIVNARLFQAEQEQSRRLQESQARLIQAEKMAALGRLIGSVAHEINNPLQAIQGCLTLLKEEAEDSPHPEKLARYLSIAEDETERIAAIVRRVRDLYRPERQEQRPTDLHAVLQGVLEWVDEPLRSLYITVEREWALDLPMIQANPDHLKQVFLDLVFNAMEAMSTWGGKLRVRTGLDQMHGRDNQLIPAVRVEFSDTGEGIPAEILPHIFEPFVTAEKSRLGLYISYGIIEAHNGQITVASEAGVGTRFTILLPAGEV